MDSLEQNMTTQLSSKNYQSKLIENLVQLLQHSNNVWKNILYA